MTQDELNQLVGRAAANYVLSNVAHGAVLGVGTGSTVNWFIDEIAPYKERFRGAVSSSNASTERLRKHGIEVLELNDIETLPVYVDGADEINAAGHMIKGGGGALTREKIVAMVAQTFVCIVDESKRVEQLGNCTPARGDGR
jgi:ribose 5-phosphate isomerase A